MNFVLTEEQALLAETARRFADEHVPLERFRVRRQTPHVLGDAWGKMAEMGWQALAIDEAYGGFGLGWAELVIVAEVLGRNLAAEPFLSSVVLSAQAIAAHGDEAQRTRWLPGLADGSLVSAFAFHERGGRYGLVPCATRAEPTDDGFVLNGQKDRVSDLNVAGMALVFARTEGETHARDGLTVFAVPLDAPGVTRTPFTRVDGLDAGTLTLTDVRVGADAVVGGVGGGREVGDAVLDPGLVWLAAEMVGAADHAKELTLDYMRGRVQFGAPIASFQALQHRMAEVFVRIELARSAVIAASRALDAGADDASALASMAKAKASQALELAAKEGIQLHGGVGMTDEYDIGFFLKRHRVAETTLADRASLRRRYATLKGY